MAGKAGTKANGANRGGGGAAGGEGSGGNSPGGSRPETPAGAVAHEAMSLPPYTSHIDSKITLLA